MMFLLYCWCISILFITGVQGPRNCHCHCHCQICVRIPVRQQWTALERQSLQHQQQSPLSYFGLWLRLRTCIRNIFWKNDCSSPILLTFMKSIVTVTVNAFQDCIHLLRDGYWRWKPSEEKNFLVFQTPDCESTCLSSKVNGGWSSLTWPPCSIAGSCSMRLHWTGPWHTFQKHSPLLANNMC